MRRKGGRWLIWFGLLSGAVLGARAVRPALRRFAQTVVRKPMERLLADAYDDNLWELASATKRMGGPQFIVETSLRAEHGTVIKRPLGSPRRWPGFDNIVFNIPSVAARPVETKDPVDTSVTLGPAARKPLRLATPIVVSGMGYGLGVSERTRIALARGAALVGTATNTGEGPPLPMEREVAAHLIVQFNRSAWGKEPATLREADMIEIQFGQGAWVGQGQEVVSARTDPDLRKKFGVKPGQAAIVHAAPPELRSKSLGRLVDELRTLADGAPIGVKIAAGPRIEEDLAHCLQAGVDVIALDGAQAGTRGSPPILQDDFGLPTLHGLVRATKFLEKSGRREQVSLLVGGGLYNPGDFLKVLALGADAVYIGTVALFAVSHGQVFKSLPWEPPTQVAFHAGEQAAEFDVDEGADRLARYLRAATAELAVGVRATGERAVRDVSRHHLVALDEETARVCDLPVTFRQ